ncbi:MAG: hypothetical protein IH858_08725 [Chloroflexi bacterium]|nr:hypothetical protein [Chloroflexota bacterium]
MVQVLVRVTSILLTTLGAIALIASEAISMFTNEAIPLEWQFWGLVFFVVGVSVPVILSQVENIFLPKIHLDVWAIEPSKRMYERQTRRFLWWSRAVQTEVRFQAAYMEVFINPRFVDRTVERVMPQVVWMDSKGETMTQNNGRWWLSHVHAYVDTSELQMVNLWPNGLRRRLYFAKHQTGQLHTWHRTYDNKEPLEPLQNGEYEIVVELNPTNGRKAKYRFVLTSTSAGMSLDRLTRWKQIQRRFRKK